MLDQQTIQAISTAVVAILTAVSLALHRQNNLQKPS
jgi:hypothetical protein